MDICAVARGTALRVAVLAATALHLAACYSVLDWDPEWLLCDGNGACAAGYSALGERCIAHGSIELNGTCSQSKQCAGDQAEVTCAPELFSCMRKCDEIYSTSTDSKKEYCAPRCLRRDENTCVGIWEGSQECSSNSDCNDGQTCIHFDDSTSACFSSCFPEWDEFGRYAHGCQGSEKTDFTCQPLKSELVCVPTGAPTEQQDGAECALVSKPCQSGSACVDGVCSKYCDTNDEQQDGCPTDMTCCEQQGLGVGVCRQEC